MSSGTKSTCGSSIRLTYGPLLGCSHRLAQNLSKDEVDGSEGLQAKQTLRSQSPPFASLPLGEGAFQTLCLVKGFYFLTSLVEPKSARTKN